MRAGVATAGLLASTAGLLDELTEETAAAGPGGSELSVIIERVEDDGGGESVDGHQLPAKDRCQTKIWWRDTAMQGLISKPDGSLRPTSLGRPPNPSRRCSGTTAIACSWTSHAEIRAVSGGGSRSRAGRGRAREAAEGSGLA